MISVNNMVSNLFDAFETCKKLKSTGSKGGSMRSVKGKAWEAFFNGALWQAIDKNKLPYTVVSGKKVECDGITITMDNGVMYKNKPLFHVENKDYIDSKMWKTFLVDNIVLGKKYPNMRFISLSGWVAAHKSTQMAITDKITDLKPGSVYVDTLLDRSRKAKENLFILDYTESQIEDQTNHLINRLTKVIC